MRSAARKTSGENGWGLLAHTSRHTKILTAFLAATSGAAAYKIRAFKGRDCTCGAQEINVWDNTCRKHNIQRPFQSFRVLAHGQWMQTAVFHDTAACNNRNETQRFNAGGQSSIGFHVDNCLNLKRAARALSST